MQKHQQFWHCFFIKNQDLFGLKISMDFQMIFSLKMASKSRPFSMKKPSKKQDVFRASQKSFFWRSWSAPGQCPMAVFIFFSLFQIFGRKCRPGGCPLSRPLASFFRLGSRTLRGGTPKTDFDAILDASLVQNDVFLTPFDVI